MCRIAFRRFDRGRKFMIMTKHVTLLPWAAMPVTDEYKIFTFKDGSEGWRWEVYINNALAMARKAKDREDARDMAERFIASLQALASAK